MCQKMRELHDKNSCEGNRGKKRENRIAKD